MGTISGEDLFGWYQAAQQQAIAHQVPLFELDWFVQALLPIDRLALRLGTYRAQSDLKSDRSLAELTDLWRQRTHDRTPVQYLVGSTHWRTFQLQVSPAVLIPRPETECLIDLAIAHLSGPYQICDLGTGSGAIALGLADAFPQAQVHAVDLSPEALAIARHNADIHHLAIQFYQGRWFEPIAHLQGQLDAIVSNPPYIPSELVWDLQPEVTQHEPHLALDGGADGLDAVRQLVAIAPDYLRSGGLWLVELMADQANKVAALLLQDGHYSQIEIHADLAGIDRFVLAHRR